MRHTRTITVTLCLGLFALLWHTDAHARRRTLGVGSGIGGGFQSGAKTGTFTLTGPIVAADGLQGIIALPSLSIRKFLHLRHNGVFSDLSFDTEWFVSNMIWKIVQGAQNGILHIPISIGAQLAVWLFHGSWRMYIAPAALINLNVFVGGGDGGIATEIQLGVRVAVEYLVPTKWFGVELSIWPFGSFGVYGGSNSQHHGVSELVSGGAGLSFGLSFHFYGRTPT